MEGRHIQEFYNTKKRNIMRKKIKTLGIALIFTLFMPAGVPCQGLYQFMTTPIHLLPLKSLLESGKKKQDLAIIKDR